MKNVSMYSGCLGSVSYICVLMSFYSTFSGLKCVPNMVRITQNTNADIVVPWPYFSVSELLISATLAMTISNVQQMCPNMSCPNAQLGPKVPSWRETSAHFMYLTRLLGKSMRWAVVYVEMRIHSEKNMPLGMPQCLVGPKSTHWRGDKPNLPTGGEEYVKIRIHSEKTNKIHTYLYLLLFDVKK